MRTRNLIAAAAAACLSLALPLQSAVRTDVPSARRPTLVVVLVVDQMSADYVLKYRRQWTGGLRRLFDGGAWFQNASYPYTNTVTCAGHATISTGAFPRTHGITGNSWWDRATGRTVECADDPDERTISYGAPVKGGKSAHALATATFTDHLRVQSSVPARVVTLSIKERTAIMLAGHRATAVTWFDLATGSFATSSAYSSEPVPFVARFVKDHPIDADLRGRWTPARASTFYSFTDAATGERPPSFWTAAFPHPLAAQGMTPAQTYQAWEESPFSDAYLERLAETAIEALHLGSGPGTDYLGVSFTALDPVGHDFGPHSHEVQDVLLRLDRDLASLLAALDRHVGSSRYVVALTADHGVSPIPEQLLAEGLPAGRIASSAVRQIDESMAPAAGSLIAARSGGQLYLSAAGRDAIATDRPFRDRFVARLERVPGVARVLLTNERSQWNDADPLARSLQYGYFPNRTGDVVVIQQPYWLFGDGSAAGHGTPYRYDTWVPMVLYGTGVKAGRYQQAVTPADIAPTLAWLCDLTLPHVDGRPLVEALKTAEGRARAGGTRSSGDGTVTPSRTDSRPSR